MSYVVAWRYKDDSGYEPVSSSKWYYEATRDSYSEASEVVTDQTDDSKVFEIFTRDEWDQHH